jgi:hypothetical protein
MMKLKQLHLDLSQRLEELSEDLSTSRLLECLQDWLRQELGNFSSETVQRYRLAEFATIELGRYPRQRSTMNPAEEIRRLIAVSPSSMETLAMFLRDVLWAGITVSSGVWCPNCDCAELVTNFDETSQKIVFACDRCIWAQTPEGAPLGPDCHLVPATNIVLEQFGAVAPKN